MFFYRSQMLLITSFTNSFLVIFLCFTQRYIHHISSRVIFGKNFDLLLEIETKDIQQTHYVTLTSIHCHLNVVDAEWTLKEPCVFTWGNFHYETTWVSFQPVRRYYILKRRREIPFGEKFRIDGKSGKNFPEAYINEHIYIDT